MGDTCLGGRGFGGLGAASSPRADIMAWKRYPDIESDLFNVHGLNHSYTDAGTLYAQAGVDIGRIDDAVSTIAAEIRKIAAEPLGPEELEKARNFAKGRFVLQLESPQGLMMFGLRKEVLERRLPDPEEVLRGLDAVTSEDIARVATDLIGADRLRLAVIGPFDDTARFETLLDG